MEKDKEFLEFIVKNIVDHPETVEVERIIDERGVLLSLKVNPEDMGQVIGREGATAKAMRALLRTIGAKNNARVNLKILEPEGSTGLRRREEPVAEEAPRQTKPEKDIDAVVEDLKL